MQHESVLFCCLSFLHSEQFCELHMCNTQFSMQVKKYEEEREEWIHTHTHAHTQIKRPGCFYSGTPLDGTMCPHKTSHEATLRPSAESAAIKVKVSLQSGWLFLQ